MDSHSSLTPSEPDWIAINGYKWSIYTMDYHRMFRNGLTTSSRPTSSVEVGTTNSVWDLGKTTEEMSSELRVTWRIDQKQP